MVIRGSRSSTIRTPTISSSSMGITHTAAGRQSQLELSNDFDQRYHNYIHVVAIFTIAGKHALFGLFLDDFFKTNSLQKKHGRTWNLRVEKKGQARAREIKNAFFRPQFKVGTTLGHVRKCPRKPSQSRQGQSAFAGLAFAHLAFGPERSKETRDFLEFWQVKPKRRTIVRSKRKGCS